jgi:hypothetical protein
LICNLKLHAKFHNPRTTSSGRKVTGSEEKEERKREKKPVNNGHRVLLATPKGSACNSQRPTFWLKMHKPNSGNLESLKLSSQFNFHT